MSGSGNRAESSRSPHRRAVAGFAISVALGLAVLVPARTEAQWRDDLFAAPDGLERSLAAMALGSTDAPLTTEITFDLLGAAADYDPAVHAAARHLLRKRATDSAAAIFEIAFSDFARPSPYLAEGAARSEASNLLSGTKNREVVRRMFAIALDRDHPRRDLAESTLARNAATCSLEVLLEEIERDPKFPIESVGGIIVAAMTKPRLQAGKVLVDVARRNAAIERFVVNTASRLAADPTPQTFAMLEEIVDVVGPVHAQELMRLAAALDVPSPTPRVRNLVESLGPRSAEVVAGSLTSSNPQARNRARRMLAWLGRPESRFAALRRIDLDDADNRSLVESLLSRVEARDADELLRLCREPIVASRRVALSGIERLPGEFERFRDELLELARDSDPRVGSKARALLERGGAAGN